MAERVAKEREWITNSEFSSRKSTDTDTGDVWSGGINQLPRRCRSVFIVDPVKEQHDSMGRNINFIPFSLAASPI